MHTFHTLTIEKIVHGGHGLARLPSGIVSLTPFVLPEEKVRVKEVHRQKDFVSTEVIEVLEPSPHRIKPQCRHYQKCGGCHLQHADYNFQVDIKQKCLDEMLSHNLRLSGITSSSFLKSKDIFHYRQRIRLQVDNHGRLGFFARKSHSLEALSYCPLSAAPINEVLKDISESNIIRKIALTLSCVDLLLSPVDQQIVVILHIDRKPRPADYKVAREIAELDLIKSVWFDGSQFAMDGPIVSLNQDAGLNPKRLLIFTKLAGNKRIDLSFEPGGFCQVNLAINEHLIALLLKWIQPKKRDRILDLFCGMGNFSVPLAMTGADVVGTDSQRSSIRSAINNGQENALENCRFFRSDAGQSVNQFIKNNEKFDIIILDPPRQGCKKIIKDFHKLNAHTILYISCDPSTLIRDLIALKKVGYELDKITGLDMFPQTYHFETAALMKISN